MANKASKGRASVRPDDARRTGQVCAVAERALGLAFAEHEELSDARVAEVMPDGSVARLLVWVEAGPGCLDIHQLQEDLHELKPELRCAVAERVNRKRAPDLSFIVMWEGAWPEH